jgi:acetyl-CoA acyltransferase
MESGLSEAVWIAGVGMTPFGVHRERSIKELTRAVVQEALDDAGAEIEHVDAAFFGNTAQGALEGQLSVGGQVALRAMGFQQIPIANVESACATGALALHLAVSYVRSGQADIALAVGAEKLHVGPPERVMELFGGGVDVHDPDGLAQMLRDLGGELPDGNGGGDGRRTVFMDIYAALTRAHMRTFGTTQHQLATVAAKNHRHAVENELAHFRRDMSVEEVLAGRPLAHPLTVPMCSPMTDGAAAALVVNRTGLRRLNPARAIRVRASVLASGTDRPLQAWERHITRQAAHRAYEQAGVGPQDVSVAEVHDATAFGEILQTELLGLCELGGGGPLAESGATSLGGRVPVNPSGGLESKGHPIGATGLGQVYELVGQLRGAAGPRQVPDARIALAENGGGLIGGEEAAAVITILGS